jgi:hypothetical protein
MKKETAKGFSIGLGLMNMRDDPILFIVFENFSAEFSFRSV